MLTGLQNDIEQERETGEIKQNELRTTQALLNAARQQLHTVENERDQLCNMLTALQSDRGQEQGTGEIKQNELRADPGLIERDPRSVAHHGESVKRNDEVSSV